jgi:hypothetical protein
VFLHRIAERGIGNQNARAEVADTSAGCMAQTPFPCDTTATAFVKRRTTKSGVLSTALVESYMDERGRPRQRILANMHGGEDELRALGRLVVQRDRLRKERQALELDIEPVQIVL